MNFFRSAVALLAFTIVAAPRAAEAADAPAAVAPAAVPPADAAKKMTLPPGFGATLFAGEPDVVQPIAFTTDDRGRLWVVEGLSYPKWHKEGEAGNDRVVIFEDTNGDGTFDSRKVFFDKGANLFNGLTWGPDGWLYGMNGIQSYSLVGTPETPENQRQHIDCGVWRLHPITRQFEAVAWGTTNPWGLDFDDHGEMFITNCVIAHLWHVIPGAHFKRMYGQDINPHVYKLMDTCADHVHFVGNWTDVRKGPNNNLEAGGGHAHVGAMVYLGDNWPDAYRNTVFTCNLHGNRVNNDVLQRSGSGYVAHHGKDFLFANDTWFRGLELEYGPDGGVYVTDWSDTGECHDIDDCVKTSGRIYKVTYGRPQAVRIDVAKLGDAQLVELQLHKNDWQVRHARRVLQERAAAGKLGADVRPALQKIFDENRDVTRRLRALWALYAIGALDDAKLTPLLDDASEYVRAWATRLIVEDRKAPAEAVSKFARMAAADPSPYVRLHIASACQRLTYEQRWAVVEALASHAGDAQDPNLPLMIWYAAEPIVPTNKPRAAALMAKVKIPIVREHIARRLAAARGS